MKNNRKCHYLTEINIHCYIFEYELTHLISINRNMPIITRKSQHVAQCLSLADRLEIWDNNWNGNMKRQDSILTCRGGSE